MIGERKSVDSNNELFDSLQGKKIAIVHDALVVPAGSERVALFLSEVFPKTPVYTSAYLPENTFPEFKGKEIHTLPFAGIVKNERQFKQLYPLWLLEFSLLNLSGYDVVISSANYLAKYINPPKSAIHICYLHNPVRFLWKPKAYSAQSVPFGEAGLAAVRLLMPVMKNYDIKKTRKIDRLITNSKNTAAQIKEIYQKDAEVIYPPVDVRSFSISETPGDFYLYAGRLISHKRVDIAIKACAQLQRKLIIAGDGLERGKLEELAGDSATFLGKVSDEEMKNLYANCRALLFPSDEDFGLVPVEVQAAGRPVIAYRAGGALETVIDGKTGVFFNEQTEESLKNAILRFELMHIAPGLIRENAMNFDISTFKQKIMVYVNQSIYHRTR